MGLDRYAPPHEQLVLKRLARDLRVTKPHGWSVVLGNDEVVVRPPDRTVGKFSIKPGDGRFPTGFFSRGLNYWNKWAYFDDQPNVATEIWEWMAIEVLVPTKPTEARE
ncbi:MAG TPA: hypothetical protein VFW96_01175 [Thermomicrobiales bacterium]|nr:hypothetical protein [Thermomicrobiales bacterium]